MLVAGHPAGYWRRGLTRTSARVEVELTASPSKRTAMAVHDAAARYAGFLQRPLDYAFTVSAPA